MIGRLKYWLLWIVVRTVAGCRSANWPRIYRALSSEDFVEAVIPLLKSRHDDLAERGLMSMDSELRGRVFELRWLINLAEIAKQQMEERDEHNVK